MPDVDETPQETLQRADKRPKVILPRFSFPSLTVFAWIVLVALILTVGFIAGYCISNMFETHYVRP